MMNESLGLAIAAAKAGDKVTARQLLAELVGREPNNDTAWLWLAACVESVDQKRYCLNRALTINPSNASALQALARLEPVELPSVNDVVAGVPENDRVSVPWERAPSVIATPATSAVTVIIIVLLVVLGLWWLGIGLLQLSVGLTNNPYFRSGDMQCIGIWNLVISVINLASISDVVRHYRRAVSNLTLLAVVGSFFGLVQILLAGAWLQVFVVPVYVVLGVLAQVNKAEFSEFTPKELKKQEERNRKQQERQEM